MTSFRFIHAADLHLGSPFRGLSLKDGDIAAVFVEASRKAFSNLVTIAVESAVDFMIIAGDVYDGDWKDNKIGLFFNREMARLERAGIPVYLLKGNHDADSVITRTISLPPNVHEFPTARPDTFRLPDLKVALHGQGFAHRSANDNLSLGYPKPETGWFNVGVLHTSLTGREPHASYAPCSLDDLRSRGYDYWALGHVHEYEVVSKDPLTVFPGNLQGRSIREQGSKGAVLVCVEDGQATLERIVVDEARFAEVRVMVEAADDLGAILRRVEEALEPAAALMEGRITALRLHLTGESSIRADLIARRDDVRDEMQAACHRVHADIWLEKLDIAITAPMKTARIASGLDMEALLAGIGDEAMLAEAKARIAEILPKLPAGAADEQPLGADAQTLLAEARDLLMSRGTQAG